MEKSTKLNMEMTQKATDLLIYFMPTWLTYPVKLFGVIILKFYNFERQNHPGIEAITHLPFRRWHIKKESQ